jgi:ribosomal protein S18 acetylase RimI-like enzyme
MAAPAQPVPRSLVWATSVDVLPRDRVVERRDDHLVIRSPQNPTHWWGNLLLFDGPPQPGDGERWEALFGAELPGLEHRTFSWDTADGETGALQEEFAARGYDLSEDVGLVADAGGLRPHARENREVVVRTLDAAAGADEELWAQVLDLQVANRDERHDEESFRAFSERWLGERRELLETGPGAWYVALDPESGAVAGSCGIVVTGGRGRYQSVDTALEFRRRGICSRLVVEAARHAEEHHGAEQLVIVADLAYHALGLYESLGFERREHTVGVCLPPASYREG